jgi:hypothetical protein
MRNQLKLVLLAQFGRNTTKYFGIEEVRSRDLIIRLFS